MNIAQRLQRVFALGHPVVVWGPGCHRIGYDYPKDPGWQTITDRARRLYAILGAKTGSIDDADAASSDHRRETRAQQFLQEYWKSKLSEETREFESVHEHRLSRAPDGHEPLAERIHTGLGSLLLRAYYESSCALGELIAQGHSPVIDWRDVSTATLPEDVDLPPQVARAGDAVETAAELAHALTRWRHRRDRLVRADSAVLHKTGVLRTDADPAENDVKTARRSLDVLKMADVAGMLGTLNKRCFSGAIQVALNGAVVEWLGDLLWHVLSAGAQVPLSQTQLTFYVNLEARSDLTPDGFVRARPGDYRHSEETALERDIKTMLEFAYPAEPSWALPREKFALAVAASLRVQWTAEQLAQTEHNLAVRHLVLALVSDYDTLLEDALRSLLQPGEAMHTIVPMYVTRAGRQQVEWLFGTTRRTQNRYQVDEVSSWQWLRTVGTPSTDDPVVEGPIIVKLNGDPRLSPDGQTEFKGEVDAYDLGELEELAGAHLQPAVFFSERAALEAMTAFSELADLGPGTLAETLLSSAGLSWSRRSWLFLGHGFSDWLARLRLYLTSREQLGEVSAESHDNDPADGRGRRSKKLGGGTDGHLSAKVVEHIAVDRTFAYPEHTLLQSLNVGELTGDLESLIGYYGEDYPAREAEVREFADAVGSQLGEITR